MAETKKSLAEGLAHCSAKVAEITQGPLADPAAWPADRRWWLQLGFNLGRFSELSGEGRKVWDDWKAAVEAGDTRRMEELAHLMNLKAVEANQQE
jgi:hypothetical protein